MRRSRRIESKLAITTTAMSVLVLMSVLDAGLNGHLTTWRVDDEIPKAVSLIALDGSWRPRRAGLSLWPWRACRPWVAFLPFADIDGDGLGWSLRYCAPNRVRGQGSTAGSKDNARA